MGWIAELFGYPKVWTEVEFERDFADNKVKKKYYLWYTLSFWDYPHLVQATYNRDKAIKDYEALIKELKS